MKKALGIALIFVLGACLAFFYIKSHSSISLRIEGTAWDHTHQKEYDGTPPVFSESSYNLHLKPLGKESDEIIGSEQKYDVVCVGKSNEILKKKTVGFVFSAQASFSCNVGSGGCISPVRFHFIVNMKCPKRTVKVRLTQDEKVLSEREVDFEIN